MISDYGYHGIEASMQLEKACGLSAHRGRSPERLIVKYSPAKSGWKGPAPTREEHQKDDSYQQFGTGGVDFVGFLGALREKGYDSWASLDFDAPRPSGGKISENMDFRKKVLGGHIARFAEKLTDLNSSLIRER